MSGDRCEDFPCFGHGPTSGGGDGGGCPDSEGRYDCVTCGRKMKRGETSAICGECRSTPMTNEEADRCFEEE